MGRCTPGAAPVKAAHSSPFQSQAGTLSAEVPPEEATWNSRAFNPLKARAYSPLGSSTIKRAFGSPFRPAFVLASRVASSDQRISPATEQDLPAPVLPRTARCRPKSLLGST